MLLVNPERLKQVMGVFLLLRIELLRPFLCGGNDFLRIAPAQLIDFVRRAWRSANSSVLSSALEEEYRAGMCDGLERRRRALARMPAH